MKHKILVVLLCLSLIGTAAAQVKVRDGKMEVLKGPDIELFELETDVQAKKNKLVYAINTFGGYPLAYMDSTSSWGYYVKAADYDTVRTYIHYYAHKKIKIRFIVQWLGPEHWTHTSEWETVKKNTWYSWYAEMMNLTTWAIGKYEVLIKIETETPTVGPLCFRTFAMWLYL